MLCGRLSHVPGQNDENPTRGSCCTKDSQSFVASPESNFLLRMLWEVNTEELFPQQAKDCTILLKRLITLHHTTSSKNTVIHLFACLYSMYDVSFSFQLQLIFSVEFVKFLKLATWCTDGTWIYKSGWHHWKVQRTWWPKSSALSFSPQRPTNALMDHKPYKLMVEFKKHQSNHQVERLRSWTFSSVEPILATLAFW